MTRKVHAGRKHGNPWELQMTTTAVSSPRFDEIVRHPDDSVTAYSYFAPSEATMLDAVEEIFVHNWRRIVVGPCLDGAVFELCFKEAPQRTSADGYRRHNSGSWHHDLGV